MELIQNVNIVPLSKASKGRIYKSVAGLGKGLLRFNDGAVAFTLALNTDEPNPLHVGPVSSSDTLYNELGNAAVMVDPTSAKLVAGQDFKQASAFRRGDDCGITAINPTTLETTFITVSGEAVSVGADELILKFEIWSLGYMNGDDYRIMLSPPRPKSAPISVSTKGIY